MYLAVLSGLGQKEQLSLELKNKELEQKPKSSIKKLAISVANSVRLTD